MKGLRGRLTALAVGAVGVGAALAFALPAGAAVSLQSQSPPVPSSVSLGKRATLDANGAVVFPSVKFVCATGQTANLSVIVTENVGGGRIAKGGGFRSNVACTGSAQTLRIAVTPDNWAFRRGVAFGQLFASICSQFQCEDQQQDEHVIRIV
jgi:hypothetical protein